MQRRTAASARKRGTDPPASEIVLDTKPKNAFKPKNDIKGIENLKKYIDAFVPSINDFLHARTGVKGCRLAGIIRVCYASLYLYSIILMAIQVSTLFDPRKGLIPYFISGEDMGDYDYSVFEFAPNSSLIVYFVFLIGISSGFLLLLGVQPRWGAIGAFFFLHNLMSHNSKIFDHEFYMNKMWAFFLIMLPLDHYTVYDDFGGLVPNVRKHLVLPSQQPQQRQTTRTQSTSWPMWPFRLWQIYTCMIYMGAGWCKLNTPAWQLGNALSWCWYDETLGRFYPAFVVELLYNRLISIKLQTWMSLLIENICVITIWPMKTRKITFVAIVFLHIGIELALVMHIFEYLSVLGWVCFLVYPNDGEAEKILIKTKEKKYYSKISMISTNLGTKRRYLIETTVAISLLYLLIYDIYPREEAEELIPYPLGFLIWKFVYPPSFIDTKLNALVHLMGIHAGPYILFKGKPPHHQNRMTAVIRFNDGKQPILYQEADWATTSFVRREIDYWYDTYTYYLMMMKARDPNDIPLYAAMSVHLAELYGNGGIDRRYNKISIKPDNTVESVSIQVHRRDGSELPAPPGWGLFQSIPREWRYRSSCEFVFVPHRVQLDNEKVVLNMEDLWVGYEDASRQLANGCVRYNPADEALHRKGQYGEPNVYPYISQDAGVSDTGSDDNEEGDDTGRGFIPQLSGASFVRNHDDEEGDDTGRGFIPQLSGASFVRNDDDEEGDDTGRGFIPQLSGASVVRNDNDEEGEDSEDGDVGPNLPRHGVQQHTLPMNQGDDAGGYFVRNENEEAGEGSGDNPQYGNRYAEQQYRMVMNQGGDDDGENNGNNVGTIRVVPYEDIGEGDASSDVGEGGTSPPYVDPDFNGLGEDSGDGGSSYDLQHRSLRARY